MSTVLRVSRLKVPFVAGILSLATCAAAETIAPIIYQGLRHSPIGHAVLQVDASRNTLAMTTTDPNGGDGVAVDLGGRATSWTAYLAAMGGGLPLVMTWHAIADGQRISTAVLREVGGRVAISARFTGATTSTYAVQVFDQGRLVGSLGGLPPTAQTYLPDWLPCEFLEHGCSFIPRFRNTVYGECEWAFVFRDSRPIALPNGVQLTGTEVRLIEEVRAAGHYPYLTFDGVTMQTNARVLTLFSEGAR